MTYIEPPIHWTTGLGEWFYHVADCQRCIDSLTALPGDGCAAAVPCRPLSAVQFGTFEKIMRRLRADHCGEYRIRASDRGSYVGPATVCPCVSREHDCDKRIFHEGEPVREWGIDWAETTSIIVGGRW